MSMHIAFFNRSYYPDQAATGQLLTDLCEGLVHNHGCQVTVVTGRPLHPLPGTDVSQRKLLAREERNGVYRIERSYGSFYRVVPLPDGAMTDQANATFKDGVLEIKMPAPPEQVSRGRRLQISRESSESKNQAASQSERR